MSFKIMPKTALPGWVEQLCRQYRVVGPIQKHGQTVFGEISRMDELCLDYRSTVLPPKKYLTPQQEVLLRYRMDGSHIEAVIEPEQTVVLGVHTCDVHAMMLFDRIFGQGFTDKHYQSHRDNTFIVSIECLLPCSDQSFCRDMGTASVADGYDLHMIDLGDAYAINVGRVRGEDLLKGFRHVFDVVQADMVRINKRLGSKWGDFPYRLHSEVHELPDLLTENYDNDLWNELGDRCLACGMCTQVCPTCYCFDVTDETDLMLEEGRRVRRWDSCQIHEFAMVAGGHNFRERLAARQRHRFMRKGKYQMNAFDMVGCVGCGRCASACLVHISPVEVFNELHVRSDKEIPLATLEVK